MQVRHRIAAATLLGLAALAGTVALSQTVHLGADAKKPVPVDGTAIAKRNAVLDAAQRSAENALAQKTPALPKVPDVGPVAIPDLGPIVVTRVVPGSRRGSAARPADVVAPANRRAGATAEQSKKRREREAEDAKHRREKAAEAAKEGRDPDGKGDD